MGILRFFARRLAGLLFTMVVATLLVFMVSEWSPGQAARKVLGPYALQSQVDILTQQLGLDRPVFIRYGEWLLHVLQGDLGFSLLYKTEVNHVIWGRLANTSLLAAV